jgi:carbon storage regulator
MLVLSRRVNEKIVIPDLDITIQVVSIRPGVVRLGIEAPRDVSILREELCEREEPCEPPREGRDDWSLPQPTVVLFHRS